MKKHIFAQIPENGIFWLLLFSLAIGSANSLYQKITDKHAGYEVHTEHISAVTTSGTLPVISMKEFLSPEFFMPDGFSLPPVAVR